MLKILYNFFFIVVFYCISSSQNITRISEAFYDAKYKDVFIDGNYAYLASDSKFFIYNILNRLEPQIESVLELNAELLKLNVGSGYAYIAAGSKGIRILDITNRKSPTLITSIENIDSVTSVIRSGNYLFASCFTGGIKIFDVSNIQNPVFITSLIPGKFLTAIDIKQPSFLYAVVSSEAIYCFDFSNINNIVQRSVYNSSNIMLGIKIVNDLAYVADYSAGLRTFSISNPDVINLLQTKSESVGAYSISSANNRLVVAKKNFSTAKILNKINFGFDIYSISIPFSPQFLSYVQLSDINNTNIDANYLYYVSDKNFGIYNIFNPSQPLLITNKEVLGKIYDVIVEGNYAYISTSNSGLAIADVSNLRIVKRISNYSGAGSVFSAVKRDSLLYLACGQGFRVINIKNPASIALVGSFNYPGGNQPSRISLSGDSVAYLSGGSLPGISVLNIKNLNNIYESDRKSSGPLPYSLYPDIFSKDTILFTVNEYFGFYTYQLKNDFTLSLLSNIGAGGLTGVTYNDYVFIAAGSAGMRIINVSNLLLPSQVNSVPTFGNAKSVNVVNNKAYISNGYAGIFLMDVSDVQNPFRIEQFKTYGNVTRLFVKDSLIFSAETEVLGIYKTEKNLKYFVMQNPNGGETWFKGNTHRISWISNNITGNVAVFYSDNGGLSYNYIISSGSLNTGFYDWTIPNDFSSSTNAKIKIVSVSDSTVYDESNDPFTITTASNVNTNNIMEYNLSQNYPNPFNPNTTIRFSIPKRSKVKIEIFGIMGESVGILFDKVIESGIHSVNFNGYNLSSGIYICKLSTDNFSKSIKMSLIK